MSHTNYDTYRYAAPYVYVVASEEPSLVRESIYAMPRPTLFHVLTVELERGTIVQDVIVKDEKVQECRIEDVDSSAVLISVGKRHLRYYGREGGQGK